MGDLHNVTQPTVSNIVKRVSRAIAKFSSKFIKFPTFESSPAIRQQFYDIGVKKVGDRGFPGMIGAIDGCQIPIISPGSDDAKNFKNRKGFFSVNVHGICDTTPLFTNIVAHWYGSAHDS